MKYYIISTLDSIEETLHDFQENLDGSHKKAADVAESQHLNQMRPTRLERETLYEQFKTRDVGSIEKVSWPQSKAARMEAKSRWVRMEDKGLVTIEGENVFRLTQRGHDEIRKIQSLPMRIFYAHLKKITGTVVAATATFFVNMAYEGGVGSLVDNVLQGF